MIFSAWGALFFLEKLATFFSRRPQILKTHAKTANHSHPPNLPRPAKISSKIGLLLCLGGVHLQLSSVN